MMFYKKTFFKRDLLQDAFQIAMAVQGVKEIKFLAEQGLIPPF